MQITDLLQLPQIRLHSTAADLPAAVHTLCGLLAQGDAVQDAALLEQDVLARLAQGCICMGNGLAVPHAKTAAVRRAALAAITLDKPMDCPTPDGEPVVVTNLTDWARQHTADFGMEPTEASAAAISSGFRQIKRSMEGKFRRATGQPCTVSTYKGWTLVAWEEK